MEVNRISDQIWEIPKFGGMLVPGRIYTSQKMLETTLQNDEAIKQVVNVAHLPGIQKYSLAMPDIHWGYGFPIGGVAATDLDEGVISPGGVGYDINCGVRLARTSLTQNDVQKRIKKLVENLFKDIPTGVGASGAIRKLSSKEIRSILVNGSQWAVAQGFGTDDDITKTEEKGKMENADPSLLSDRAIERGQDQAGTLGSGNHFLEIDVVDEIFDEQKAEVLGLFKNQIVIMIHTGSRGLGYQVCDDYLKVLVKAGERFGFNLPDKQLACAPINSSEGHNYLSAMRCAANFAWNNRQVIMHLAKKSLQKTLNISESELKFELIYDVCHNIAKIETHNIDGEMKRVCVHRKGATRAFPPGHKDIPEVYQSTGQPVLIPGDMGRYSFVSAGTEKSMSETFGSSCHGAGRVQSRHKALKAGKGKDLIGEMNKRGIEIQAKGYKTIAEEMPNAYKDVSEVVDVMHLAGISTKVAKIKPVGVIKG
ncbi:MAG: RtcB family protein [Melioribacteraceae bacterium]|nr:RtcB family protein [Melioribacteraceae bacterium]MCF8394122.1 RtcB family protein [Melioribacteraceae bacterium]MCF8418140.1 RtcB family protein [Melioribacteraceae bacterium]